MFIGVFTGLYSKAVKTLSSLNIFLKLFTDSGAAHDLLGGGRWGTNAFLVLGLHTETVWHILHQICQLQLCLFNRCFINRHPSDTGHITAFDMVTGDWRASVCCWWFPGNLAAFGAYL